MVKSIKKMQAGGVTKSKAKTVGKSKMSPKKGEPTYDRLPLGMSLEQEERTGYRSEGPRPSKQDSAAYKYGYNLGKRGVKSVPNESPVGRMGRWEGQNEKPKAAVPKKKMKNGGSLSGLKASTKRVGPVDPNGAWTKVQEKTLAGARGKAVLKKDKQLGATKMKMGGKVSKKK
jgi:hypothetical protein